MRTDLSTPVMEAEAVFIAVGTPSRRGDGHADLSYVYAAAREIAAGNPKLSQINNNWRC
jgi:UDPglucose 6-dehydrogenase